MKSFYIALLAVLLFSLPTQAQKNSTKRVKFKKGQIEQGVTAADGRRTGKWNFYNIDNELELTFDYDSSRINFTLPDTSRYLVRVGDQWELKHMTRAPRLLGSNMQRYLDIGSKLRYPPTAIQEQRQGTVILSFTVDTDGHTKDYTFENSISPECDQEVWRVVKDLPDNWIPAIYQGQLTATRFFLLVRFQVGTGTGPISSWEDKRITEITKSYVGQHFIQGVVVTARF